MDLIFWLLLLLSFLVFTYLMKHFFNAKTWYIASMIKSKKLAKILDKYKNSKFFDFIAKSGVFLGFGFLGIYYWYRKNKNYKAIILWQLFVSGFAVIIPLILFNTMSLTNKIISFFIISFSGLSGFAIYTLLYYSGKIILNYILGKHSCPGVAPVIPGVKLPGIPIKIPFLEGWLALIIILILHEFAHGVLARQAKIKVKSFGLILLGFFPIGAFTEPDEKQLETTEEKKQLKIYASGPMINFYLGIFVIIINLIFFSLAGNYMQNINNKIIDGIYIKTTEYTGFCNDGVKSINKDLIKDQAKIIAVDNKKILTVTEFTKYIANKNEINLKLDLNGNLKKINLKKNSDGKYGILLEQKNKNVKIPFTYNLLLFIAELLHWLFILTMMIAIFNFLPTEPFDGGKMTKIILGSFILQKYTKKERESKIGKFFGILLLILIIINILPWFF